MSPGAPVSVGREPGSFVMFHDERVSRQHGILAADERGWAYTDLGSSNGSFLNGQRVTSVRIVESTLLHLGNPTSGPTLELSISRTTPTLLVGLLAMLGVVVIGIGVLGFAGRSGLAVPATTPVATTTATATPSATTLSRADVAAIGRAGTVYVIRGNAQGSGAYLGNGRIVTAAHVVNGSGGPISIRFNDVSVGTAALVRLDEDDDVALLTIQGLEAAGAVALRWGDSGALRQGDDLIALGYPEGLPLSTKVGVVSGLRRLGTTELIQTDASLNHGMSGGPVLDAAGRLVGLVDFGFPQAQGLNFAVASNTARPFVEGR